MVQSLPFFRDLMSSEDAPEKPRALSVQELVVTNSDFVWRQLRRLGVPEHAVDDATQQVFITAAEKIDRIVPGSERAFLYAVLANVAAHARRTLARGREHAYGSDAQQRVADPGPAPDEVVSSQETRALLDEALDALPYELRQVFVLFELEELTTPDIAVLTGVPAGTVASRLRRAREEFQKIARRLGERETQKTRGQA